MGDITVDEFKSKVEDLGGFNSVTISPHMRFRAGQRRLNWERIRESLKAGEIKDAEINHNPNESIPYQEAYIIFLSVQDEEIIVPLYILENQSMKAVTVMRK